MAQFDDPKTSATRRKLTTIFAADVQGYSRLMEHDEEGTLATLKQYRDAMARLIGSHGGRVVNTWGDGVLAEFPSVVEAVRAAVDVQNELAEHNAGRSTDTRMLFRIGINLGDVIVEGDDIYGDGVNIAARLQTQAAPGGIVISNTVYDQVRNKVPVGFEFLGNLTVKNIEEGVPSYAIRVGEQTAEAPARPAFGRNAASEMPTAPQIPDMPARQPSPVSALETMSSKGIASLMATAAILVAINVLTWGGEFWAKWPLLALAFIGGLNCVRKGQLGDRGIATLAVIGLGIVVINLFTWHGEFWAKWPLLGLAIAAAIRWLSRSRTGDESARR
jgi:adenylate cyclase